METLWLARVHEPPPWGWLGVIFFYFLVFIFYIFIFVLFSILKDVLQYYLLVLATVYLGCLILLMMFRLLKKILLVLTWQINGFCLIW